jgi:FixJ family two-component response regulator
MLARARRDGDALDLLTPRQHEVLALMAEGRSNAAIAQRLSITEKPWSATSRTSTTSSACRRARTTTGGCSR